MASVSDRRIVAAQAPPDAFLRAVRPRAHTIRYEIQDLGSLNGTWINGERLSAERNLSEWRTLKGGCAVGRRRTVA